jgi:hypothetical protein
MDRTVTGSVELMIVPNNSAIKKGISYQRYIAPNRIIRPMVIEDTIGDMIASTPMGRIFRMISL